MDIQSSFIIISQMILFPVVTWSLLLTFVLISKVIDIHQEEDINRNWLKPGKPAPKFVAFDINGNQVSFESFQNQSVLFAFIKPSCRSCSTLIPILLVMAPEIEMKGIKTVIVIMATEEQTKNFVNQYSITTTVLIASRHESKFVEDYRVGATPFYCLVNNKKKVQEVGYLAPWWDERKNTWKFTFDHQGQSQMLVTGRTPQQEVGPVLRKSYTKKKNERSSNVNAIGRFT